MNIQWFPGHMTKALRMMEESLRLVDALIYVIDARAVYSCNNPLFDRLTSGKRVLYVFNKCDLVEKSDLDKWCAAFEAQGKRYVKAVGISGDCAAIVTGLKETVADKLEKYRTKGASVSVRAMVVGVPNSGKSTIINAMCKKAKAITGDRPGVTKGKQWLSVDGVDFLDTPGTLWGKFEDGKVALHLAFIGSIRDEVLDTEELACEFLSEVYPGCRKMFAERYSIGEDLSSAVEVYEAIAASRGFRLKGGECDYSRTARAVIDDFRKGRIGKIMLEYPETSGLRLKNKG